MLGALGMMGIGAGTNLVGGLLQSRALRKQARQYGRIANQLESQYSEAADPFRGLLGELEGVNAGQLGYERAARAYANPALQANLEASLGIQGSRRQFANMQDIARVRQQAQVGSAAIGAASDIETQNMAARQAVMGEIAGLETEGARLAAQMRAGGADLRSQARQGIAQGFQQAGSLGMQLGAQMRVNQMLNQRAADLVGTGSVASTGYTGQRLSYNAPSPQLQQMGLAQVNGQMAPIQSVGIAPMPTRPPITPQPLSSIDPQSLLRSTNNVLPTYGGLPSSMLIPTRSGLPSSMLIPTRSQGEGYR